MLVLFCAKPLDDSAFSITATEHNEVTRFSDRQFSGDMFGTFSQVTNPYQKIPFKGDPSNIACAIVVRKMDSVQKISIWIDEHLEGRYIFDLL